MSYVFGPQDGGSFAQAQWELLGQILSSTGVARGKLNQLAVSAGTGMQVQVATGQAWILAYFFQSDAVTLLALSAADPTNPRIDRVVVHADRSAHTADIRVLTGTPGATPVEPALTQNGTVWEIALASVAVAAAASVPGTITDERTYQGDKNANGDTIWTSGNDGSGSGLDSDTVDGKHASGLVQVGTGNLAATPVQVVVVGPSSANLPAAGVKGRVGIVAPFSLP